MKSSTAIKTALPANPQLSLPNGASVERQGPQLVARDVAGQVILRFDGVTVELVAAADMVLNAPQGGVAIQCRDDVVIDARTIRQRARQQLALQVEDSRVVLDGDSLQTTSASLEANTTHAKLSAQQTTLLTQRLATTAQTVLHEVERLEVRAGKIVERARDVLRDTSGLLQLRSGRLRSVVERSYTLITERTNMRSRAETSIDGEKILLG